MDSGLVTEIAFGYYTQRNVGPINVFAQTTPDKAKAALKAIYNEIAHFNEVEGRSGVYAVRELRDLLEHAPDGTRATVGRAGPTGLLLFNSEKSSSRL